MQAFIGSAVGLQVLVSFPLFLVSLYVRVECCSEHALLTLRV